MQQELLFRVVFHRLDVLGNRTIPVAESATTIHEEMIAIAVPVKMMGTFRAEF